MKILICHQYALAPHHAGVTRHFMLAKEMVRKGHEVTILAAATSHKNPDACRLAPEENEREEEYEGVRFRWLRAPSSNEGKFSRVWNMVHFSTRLLRVKSIEKVDIVIGNSPDPFTALAACLLARRFRVPYVLHLGDLWPSSLVEIGNIPSWHPFIILLGIIEKYLYRHADIIITPLPNATAHIVARGGRPEKIMHLPMAVDLRQIPQKRRTNCNSVFTFMFAGAHGPGNGVETIVRAAGVFEKKYPDNKYQLRLVGAGGVKGYLILLAQEMGIKNISFEPPVSKADIFNVLDGGDAFIVNISDLAVFKKNGISPNKVFDFLAMGRPVIIGCSALNNPVREADAGVCVAGDAPEDMADAMAQLMDLPLSERLKQGENGRRFIENYHALPIVSERLEQLLQGVTRCQTNELREYGT